MKVLFHKFLYTKWPAIIWSAIIFILLVFPVEGLANKNLIGVPDLDKLVHIILFFILVWLWNFYIKSGNSRWVQSVTQAALIATAYGVIMEFVQIYAGRSFSLLDMVADGAGAFLALLIIRQKIGPGKNRGRNQN